MRMLTFSNTRSAAHFAGEARRMGWRAELPHTVSLAGKKSALGLLAGFVLGFVLLGILGLLGEIGLIGFPRLGPLFASPLGGVTTLFAFFGGGLGALVGGLLTMRQAPCAGEDNRPEVHVSGAKSDKAVMELAGRYGGRFENRPMIRIEEYGGGPEHASRVPRLHWAARGVGALTAGVILTALAYIWYLSIFYGPAADQSTRIGWTMKNSQRIPADTPEAAAVEVADILGGPTLPVPADPIAAAVLGPIAAARGETLLYGGVEGSMDVERAAIQAMALLPDSPVLVVVSTQEPAYAMPAAYAAAHFQAPVIPVGEDGLSAPIRDALVEMSDRLFIVAAPDRLIPNSVILELAAHGFVQRVASENPYRHALGWARGRWENFGWGMDERFIRDGYYYFALANPADAEFAAAGLPMAYRGNYGALLYTPRDDLDPLVDQYLWRLSPKYFVVPTEGPFMNFRVLGGPESVSYNAQARADFAVETQAYRNQKTGMSGLAVLGWIWFFIGFFGAIWALFAIPKRLPETSFYPRLYWPLAMLVLGPVGLGAFLLTYQGRPVTYENGKATFVRPPWAEVISATIMSLGIGMSIMIASMYLFQLNGMPLVTWFTPTSLFWLGSPMFTVMWLIMVVPAIIISSLFYMGPMMSEMRHVSYRTGVRIAFPVVAISMISASVGMFTLIWYWTSFKPISTVEDLWLWVAPLWWGAALGFLAALIPNYLMVRAGWKFGGM